MAWQPTETGTVVVVMPPTHRIFSSILGIMQEKNANETKNQTTTPTKRQDKTRHRFRYFFAVWSGLVWSSEDNIIHHRHIHIYIHNTWEEKRWSWSQSQARARLSSAEWKMKGEKSRGRSKDRKRKEEKMRYEMRTQWWWFGSQTLVMQFSRFPVRAFLFLG